MKEKDYLFVRRVILSSLAHQNKVCINLINQFKKKYPLEKSLIDDLQKIFKHGTYFSKASL